MPWRQETNCLSFFSLLKGVLLLDEIGNASDLAGTISQGLQSIAFSTVSLKCSPFGPEMPSTVFEASEIIVNKGI